MNRSDDKSNAVWRIGENELKQVQEYKYLEVCVSLNGCEKVKNKLGKPVGKSNGECSKDEKTSKYDVLREVWKKVAVLGVMYGGSALQCMVVIAWNKIRLTRYKCGKIE